MEGKDAPLSVVISRGHAGHCFRTAQRLKYQTILHVIYHLPRVQPKYRMPRSYGLNSFSIDSFPEMDAEALEDFHIQKVSGTHGQVLLVVASSTIADTKQQCPTHDSWCQVSVLRCPLRRLGECLDCHSTGIPV